MDLCVEAPKVKYEALKNRKRQESSAQIRERVCRAREIQNQRYAGTHIISNAMLDVKELDTYSQLGSAENQLMEQAFSALGLTARTYHKILKVARTIAIWRGLWKSKKNISKRRLVTGQWIRNIGGGDGFDL